jgi:hypothetical protein
LFIRQSDGIGRRARFKIWWPQGREGSSPSSGTNISAATGCKAGVLRFHRGNVLDVQEVRLRFSTLQALIAGLSLGFATKYYWILREEGPLGFHNQRAENEQIHFPMRCIARFGQLNRKH